jgi:hypothetical protein
MRGRNPNKPTLLETFWDHVLVLEDKNKCWLWQRGKQSGGYGQVKVGKKQCKAHRIAFELFYGVTLTPEINLLHSCDNPPCCNPFHLREGTKKENVQDSIDRKRRASKKGLANGRAKVTPEEVLEIRRIYTEELISKAALGRRYGLSGTAINYIVTNQHWTEIV